jgi:hypothetical protein
MRSVIGGALAGLELYLSVLLERGVELSNRQLLVGFWVTRGRRCLVHALWPEALNDSCCLVVLILPAR